jgi:hypothetical protein
LPSSGASVNTSTIEYSRTASVPNQKFVSTERCHWWMLAQDAGTKL